MYFVTAQQPTAVRSISFFSHRVACDAMAASFLMDEEREKKREKKQLKLQFYKYNSKREEEKLNHNSLRNKSHNNKTSTKRKRRKRKEIFSMFEKLGSSCIIIMIIIIIIIIAIYYMKKRRQIKGWKCPPIRKDKEQLQQQMRPTTSTTIDTSTTRHTDKNTNVVVSKQTSRASNRIAQVTLRTQRDDVSWDDERRRDLGRVDWWESCSTTRRTRTMRPTSRPTKWSSWSPSAAAAVAVVACCSNSLCRRRQPRPLPRSRLRYSWHWAPCDAFCSSRGDQSHQSRRHCCSNCWHRYCCSCRCCCCHIEWRVDDAGARCRRHVAAESGCRRLPVRPLRPPTERESRASQSGRWGHRKDRCSTMTRSLHAAAAAAAAAIVAEAAAVVAVEAAAVAWTLERSGDDSHRSTNAPWTRRWTNVATLAFAFAAAVAAGDAVVDGGERCRPHRQRPLLPPLRPLFADSCDPMANSPHSCMRHCFRCWRCRSCCCCSRRRRRRRAPSTAGCSFVCQCLPAAAVAVAAAMLFLACLSCRCNYCEWLQMNTIYICYFLVSFCFWRKWYLVGELETRLACCLDEDDDVGDDSLWAAASSCKKLNISSAALE